MTDETVELEVQGELMRVLITAPAKLNAGSAISLAKRLNKVALMVGRSSCGSLTDKDAFKKRENIIWTKELTKQFLSDYEKHDADYLSEKYNISRKQIWAKATYLRKKKR